MTFTIDGGKLCGGNYCHVHTSADNQQDLARESVGAQAVDVAASPLPNVNEM